MAIYEPQSIDIDDRAAINEKILYLVKTGDLQGLDLSLIYHCYTGKGGLSKSAAKDYGNYTQYAAVKKLDDIGQFFTPEPVAAALAAVLDADPHDLILDNCCGKGTMLNALGQPHRFYGADIDPDALAVARVCFPEAQLFDANLTSFDPGVRFDAVVANPPFNLDTMYKGERWRSQDVFLQRAAALLKPGGFLLFVAPEEFLRSENQKRSLPEVTASFRALAQAPLDKDAFKALGVDGDVFRTKILIWQRASEHLPAKPFEDVYTPFDLNALRTIVAAARLEAERVAFQLERENDPHREERAAARKMLYHIGAHPRLKRHLGRLSRVVAEVQNAQKPPAMTFDEWDEKRPTWPAALKQLKDTLKWQHLVEKSEVRLVHSRYCLRYKGYDAATRAEAALRNGDKPETGYKGGWRLWELAALPHEVPQNVLGSEYARLVRRRVARYAANTVDLSLEPDPKEVERFKNMGFKKRVKGDNSFGPLFSELPNLVDCRLTDLQASDVARISARKYSFLAWEPGAGKTPSGFMWLTTRHVTWRVVLSTANSVRVTWQAFFRAQGTPYRIIDSRQDLLAAKAHEVLLLTFDQLSNLSVFVKRFFRRWQHSCALLVDEADALTNPDSSRTRVALNVFRRVKHKCLMTGTITRNSIHEVYPQAELLFNNSELMLCTAPTWFVEEEGELQELHNPYWLRPFDAKNGYQAFCRTFSPVKTSVFGIGKLSQDAFHLEHLNRFLDAFRLTRTFAEIAGPRYEFVSHSLMLDAAELEVQARVIHEFGSFLPYFNSTGDAKKDAQLKPERQLRLMIAAASRAEMFPNFQGLEQASSKLRYVTRLLNSDLAGRRAMVGLLRRTAFKKPFLTHWQRYLEAHTDRTVFVVTGSLSPEERQDVAEAFQTTPEGILLATQQSLSESVNIPDCDDVIVPELGFNLARLRQYFGRCVRFDMKNQTRIHLVTARNSVDANLLALLIAKERLNDIVKMGVAQSDATLCASIGIDESLLGELLTKEVNADGDVDIVWAPTQRLAA